MFDGIHYLLYIGIAIIIRSLHNKNCSFPLEYTKNQFLLDFYSNILPRFRHSNNKTLHKICQIIRIDLTADVVAITNTQQILAYSGIGSAYYYNDRTIGHLTAQVLQDGALLIRNHLHPHQFPEINSVVIIPIWEQCSIIGTIKICYNNNYISLGDKCLLKKLAAILSKNISINIEISSFYDLRIKIHKANLQALQRMISPHFIFNTLNLIYSLIRLNPKIARKLIINLSYYLRYHVEMDGYDFIDIKKELYYIKNYIAIEKIRFGKKLTVIYNIDKDISCFIPSLLIQPLLENAIYHCIQRSESKGTIILSIRRQINDKIMVSVRDTGYGISEEVIDRIIRNEIPNANNKIGLLNVHQRIKLIYGKGLHISKHWRGTEIYFFINKNM
ncbi:MAG: histidine kinase [Candidatus Dasytiphilus stammeri]